jgi:hypothetical protein
MLQKSFIEVVPGERRFGALFLLAGIRAKNATPD